MRELKLMRIGLLSVFTSMLLTACHNSGNNESATEESNSDIIKKEVILSPETQDLLNRFPAPFEVTIMLQQAKAPYIFSLTNPPANVSRYFTEKTKALNLGIYSTDLAYSSAYQKSDETEKFLYCTGKLADDLGIAGVYDKTLLEKVDAIKENRDSLVSVIKRFFGETNDFLRRNNRTQVAVLVAVGAYVEGLYIAASLCQLSPDNKQIAGTLFKQKELLDRLLRILGEYGMDSTVKPVADELTTLKPIFTEYGLGSGNPLQAQKAASLVSLTEHVRSGLVK